MNLPTITPIIIAKIIAKIFSTVPPHIAFMVITNKPITTNMKDAGMFETNINKPTPSNKAKANNPTDPNTPIPMEFKRLLIEVVARIIIFHHLLLVLRIYQLVNKI
jgi:hypothetical protein